MDIFTFIYAYIFMYIHIGTFVQYGTPRRGDATEGVRAIVHVHSKIWIAHQEASCVEVTDVLTGLIDKVLPFSDTPVGLHHNEDLGKKISVKIIACMHIYIYVYI
jgi:hypothetical protein